MANDPIYALLRASLEEQVPLTIFLRGNTVEGVVKSLDESAVELESEGRRIAVRWQSVDGAALAEHGEIGRAARVAHAHHREHDHDRHRDHHD